MLIYRRTSILESPAQTLVNTVNCVGVMGKGLAHAFKNREPEMYKSYKRICDERILIPGKLWLWRGKSNWILNFPTKFHWRDPSRIEWIEQGLEKFVSAYAAQRIAEASFPKLGCGNGNLDWTEVRPLMEHYLSNVDIPIYIHDYTVDVGLPEHLEPVAAALRQSGVSSSSYETFIEAIGSVIEFSGGKLETLGKNEPFSAHVRKDYGLAIETQSTTCLFEEDDLRGVWLDLQNGLVTERKAGWAIRGGGAPLLSLLSVLPSVRPVQIQRPGQLEPEYAIEPRPELRGMAVTGQSSNQHELSWH